MDSPGPPVSSRTVPDDAPRVNGSGPVELTVQVREEPGGVAFADAAVVVYWGDDAFDGVADASRPWTRADPAPATPRPEEILRLRAGIDGEAVARVPEGASAGVVASSPGRTQEWVPMVTLGDGDRTVEVPLYDASRSEAWNTTVGPATTTRGTQPGWEPRPVNWTGDPDVREGYQRRLARLTATLTWENGPRGGGDLALGLGANATEPDLVVDEGNETTPGEHQEQVTLEVEGIEDHGWPGAGALHAGPGTRSAGISPLGLETEVQLDARFAPFPPGAGYPPFRSHGAGGTQDAVPGPGAAATLGVLLVLAAATRRRSR